MRHRRIVAAAGALALMLPMTVASADDDTSNLIDLLNTGQTGEATAAQSVLPTSGPVNVMVELSEEPVTVVEANTDGSLSEDQEQAIADELQKAQQTVADGITSLGGQVESHFQWTYNGIQATIDASQLPAVRELPGVKDVHAMRTHERSNVTSSPYTGVDQVWDGAAGTGYTGSGIKVAVIDTGIDYTHATFGGEGTDEAFTAATAATDPTPFYARTNIKGGVDLVGDAYGTNNAPATPDKNPIDCKANGHGTHVAGTVAGKGVLADGTTYTGAYDANTFENNDFLIGPGAAPDVDLYAIKVFGCKGGTNATAQAIEVAVRDFGVDVINLSLGSDYGRVQDPSSVAAANAAAAGVVVVAAAGNAGPDPYLVGSPSVAPGVLSVAANNSIESYPGAELKVGDQSVTGVNANEEALPAAAAPIYVLDDGNGGIALGCEADEYKNVPAGSIVVTKRGECARVARAIHGQNAGAAAVIMVNTTESLPPLEGTIMDNPSTPEIENRVVTIPFLGMRASAAQTLLAANGQSGTLTAAEIPNPAFTKFASFTSAGPRTGDSHLRPTVTAPGVSIISASVGGGNDPATDSGTSMATPHVAGIAALARQAHPDWSSQEITASLISTAKPEKVGDYVPTRGGGQIDPWDATHSDVFAYTDTVAVAGTNLYEVGLSYGFQEISDAFEATKTITLVNKGTSAATYTASVEESSVTEKADVTVSPSSVTVPAGGTATIDVTMKVKATDIASSLNYDVSSPWFYEVSGNIVLKSDGGSHAEQHVPYLMVPRSLSNVTATTNALSTTSGELVFSNAGGTKDADGMIFTLGLTDDEDIAASQDTGQDLASIGVSNLSEPGKAPILAFALNNYSRYSNAAANGYEIGIDANLDGKEESTVLAYDTGLLSVGQENGQPGVFIQDNASGDVRMTGYQVLAPTDSSTVVVLVPAAEVGVTGKFAYSVSAVSLLSDEIDEVDGTAMFDPTAPAITVNKSFKAAAGGATTVELSVDPAAVADQAPKGWMAVVLDNAAGTTEALTGPLPLKTEEPTPTPTPSDPGTPAPSDPAPSTPAPSASAAPVPVKPIPVPVKPGLPDTGVAA